MTSRRAFLQAAATTAAGLSLSDRLAAEPSRAALRPRRRGFPDLRRPPDGVGVQTAAGIQRMDADGTGRWRLADTVVTVEPAADALRVRLASPATAIERIHLRWREPLPDAPLLLGDAWERGYGDLEWRGLVPDRAMPWYFAVRDGETTNAHGVRTGARAFCFWYADPEGVSLWADVRSGGAGVQLGDRALDVCDVVSREGTGGESAFAAIHAFCRLMCPDPRMPDQPVYGSNDWYWAYGRNSAATVLEDARHIVDLSPADANRPFCVIDDGWQPRRGQARSDVGIWDRGNEKFPDMPGLAGEIRRIGARPGIWIRPLLAPADAPDAWRLPREKNALDPSVPEVREKVAADIGRLRDWGFELIKHDYSTFDIFGQWGSRMGASPANGGWTFATGSSRTTAEVIDELYRTIRAAADDTLIIGCNTVSHLSAGRFEICRIGDDTSGRDWERTRRMGVNTLAFRGVQHGAFYAADPDCVGVTNDVPWSFNRQWLDLLARSGTMLFLSLAPDALDAGKRRDLRAALELAAAPQPLGEPLDWLHTTLPARWRLMNEERTYDWFGEDGVNPGDRVPTGD